MDESEQALSGGNMNAVTRVGATVRRQAGPWTAQVQRLLAHLRAGGVEGVPQPLGIDAQGREVLSFLPGTVGLDPLPAELRRDEVLIQAAGWLRRMHDATAGVAARADWRTGWQAQTREPVEVICHGDFAAYNCVFEQGHLVGVIDFDFAHPGPRLWDLGYAIYRFAPVTAPSNPDHYGSLAEQCRRVRLFCDAYGLGERAGVMAAVKARLASMADFLREGAVRGDARMLANIAEGHLAVYVNDLAYAEEHTQEFMRALEENT